MNIIFRFNAGGEWGHGHLYRDIALISKLSEIGYECFAIINKEMSLETKLLEKKVTYTTVNEYESYEECIYAIESFNLKGESIIFFDRLNSEKDYYKLIRKRGYRIISYDDDGDYCLDADIIIKSRPIIKENRKDIFAGYDYQVIRDEFSIYHFKEKVYPEKGRKVLIHFGGTDPLGLLARTYECLCGCSEEIQFLFISGSGSFDEALSIEINNKSNMAYIKTSNDFAKDLYEADVAILSGGVTSYECGTVGTPMILVAQNDDQKLTQDLLEEAVGCYNLGIGSDCAFSRLGEKLMNILDNRILRIEISDKEKAVFSTSGIDNICKIVKMMEE